MPVSFTGWAHCPEDGGEAIAWDGAMHLSYSYVQLPLGGYHEQFHANIHLNGVGLTTGDRYVANGAADLSGTYPPAGLAIVMDVEHYREIHAGEPSTADDYASVILLTRDGFVEQETCG